MAGGGARSTHGGGFLYALATELGITSPHVMIGSSGDAGNVLYYCAGQYDSARRVFLDLLCSRKFISLIRFWRILNVDYLIDTIFKKLEPLDISRVLASPIEWYIPVTDYETGIPRYLSAKDGLDPFEILRATSAVPIFYGKKVPLLGKRYIDGEVGPTLEDHVKKARELGVTRLLLVQHTAPPHLMKRLIYQTYALSTSHALRDAIMRDLHSDGVHIEFPDMKMIVLSPQNLPIRTMANSKKKLQATFERGVQDALALKDELRTLFTV